MRQIPVRHEGQALADMGRQYSAVSKATLKRLSSLENHFGDLQSAVDQVQKKVSTGTLEDLMASKNELAQINGRLEKFQFNQLDAVTTSDLTSGKDNAKIMRKQLNHAVEKLQRHTAELHKHVSERIEEVRANPELMQQLATEAKARQHSAAKTNDSASVAEPSSDEEESGDESEEESEEESDAQEDEVESSEEGEEEAMDEAPAQNEEEAGGGQKEQPLMQNGDDVQSESSESEQEQEEEGEEEQPQPAMEIAPPQPPAAAAAPVSNAVPVRRQQPQQAPQRVNARRIPVRVGGTNTANRQPERWSQVPQQQPQQQRQQPENRGMTRQQAATMLQVIGAGYNHGIIDSRTWQVLKDRIIHQDPRLVRIMPTGDVYRDLRTMVRALQ